jgi:hypothetical protein
MKESITVVNLLIESIWAAFHAKLLDQETNTRVKPFTVSFMARQCVLGSSLSFIKPAIPSQNNDKQH